MFSIGERVIITITSGELRGIVEVELDAGIYVVEVEGEFPRVVVVANALDPILPQMSRSLYRLGDSVWYYVRLVLLLVVLVPFFATAGDTQHWPGVIVRSLVGVFFAFGFAGVPGRWADVFFPRGDDVPTR
jgi:hypothetical protein